MPSSFYGWRNQLLAAPEFQRWATRTPLMRTLSRPHARALFELCSGFVHSQVLQVSVTVGLLEALSAGPLSAAELQARCHLPAAALRLLLGASDALCLTQPRPRSRWGLGILGAALLGNPAVQQMVRHQPLFYGDLADLTGLLRGARAPGALEQFWAYARRDSPDALDATAVAAYSDLMSATHALVVEDLRGAYDFSRHRCLLDVGGGEGALLASFAPRYPDLRLMLLDLPAVAARARVHLTNAGLGDRVQVVGGDFNGPLPTGADVITLVRIVHDHDDAAALRLLSRVYEALPRGGRIVIAELMRGVRGAIPAAETYLGFYLLAMGQGRVRTRAELGGLLQWAGFTRTRTHRTPRPWQCAVLSARKG
jgi:demethylspheroidene O-methyltransferase